MGADLSRIRSNPLLDFAGVELKQGGVLLDADFNEFAAVVDRRLRAAASDILGRATVSANTPDAFKLSVVGVELTIGKGRLYVDGLLAESHGQVSEDKAKKLFDPLLAETVYAEAHTYAKQPYLRFPPLPLPIGGRHLVYLDVWEREVTHLERPELVEPAVGVETSSRKQIVWQVRVLNTEAANATCGSPDDDFAGWSTLIAPSTGRLTTDTFDVPPEKDPCELPPTGGYRGLENQTYRVEIHDPGQPGGAATFKWSRENASVGSRVASVASSTELELQTLGRDDVLRFTSGDWVEIIDDRRQFSQRCGEVRKITVTEAARRISFAPPLPDDMLPDAMLPDRFPNADFPRDGNLRVRRWDQKGKVLQAVVNTPLFQDLDLATSTGVIAVPAVGTALLLENGITVSFASTTGEKGFRAGDYWVFAARTADASVEPLTNAPPRGIHHHYARLGLWDVATGSVTDCRTPWPPRGEGHDCSCTECVTAESHASGQLTIQAAVDRIHETGGTVCLGVGQFVLQAPVHLKNLRSVHIRGQGAATLLVAPIGAFSVANGIALVIEDLAVLSVGHASAITVRTALGLSLQRLIVLVLGGNAGGSAAIALSGVVVGATIRDNLLIAPVAVLANEAGRDAAARFLLSAQLRIEDNAMWCELHAVSLSGLSLHLMATRITGNEILGCSEGGVAVLGLAASGATVEFRANSLNVSGPGIVAGAGGLWIADNKLNASTPSADLAPKAGIHLRAGLDPNGADQCQVLANQIAGFEDAAILIESPTRDLIVKLNLIERCGNGIVLRGEAQAESVSIENNHLNDIGLASAGTGADALHEVLGIGVQNATAATIAGNTVRRVGLEASQPLLCAGVATAAVQRLRIAGNDVTDIGPPGKLGFAAGVVVRAPFEQADVNHNHVDRESQPPPLPRPSDDGGFTALRAEALSETGVVSRIGAYTTLWVDPTTTLTFGAKRPIIHRAAEIDVPGAVVVRGSSISVLGNILASRGGLPVVQIVTTGDCLFSDNRCELRGQGPAVQLSAGAIIVNANRVRGGDPSLEIGGITAKATVLGNITTGAIVLGAPAETPPGAPFNLVG